MKTVLLIITMLLSVTAFSQTDSTEIKLQHYKDLFIKGLITAQEYESLKQQTLGIKTPPQQPQTIIVTPAVRADKTPVIDSLQAEKFRNKYRGNIAAGTGGLVLGVGLIIGGGVNYVNMTKQLGQGQATWIEDKIIRRRNIITGMLVAFGGASTALGITALTVGISQRNKVKRYDNSLTLNIAPASFSLAFKF